jgi:hypothetical protein
MQEAIRKWLRGIGSRPVNTTFPPASVGAPPDFVHEFGELRVEVEFGRWRLRSATEIFEASAIPGAAVPVSLMNSLWLCTDVSHEGFLGRCFDSVRPMVFECR